MELVFMMHKTRKYIITNIILFFVFMGIYITLDLSANDSYSALANQFSAGVMWMHILANVLLSLLSSVVFTWSFITMQIYKKETKWSNMPVIGVFIGFLTFGCTPCVVAALSIFGITFVPMILPNGNILFKALVLLLILFSGWMTIRFANIGCEVENNPE
jgi:hypothetical protein